MLFLFPYIFHNPSKGVSFNVPHSLMFKIDLELATTTEYTRQNGTFLISIQG